MQLIATALRNTCSAHSVHHTIGQDKFHRMWLYLGQMRSVNSSQLERITKPGRLVLFLAVSILCGGLVAGILIPSVAVAATGANVVFEAMDELPTELETGPLDEGSKIYSSDGALIATFYSENRVPVELDQISPHMRDAIVAIEDARFYDHNGIDLKGIARAFASNLTQDSMQGASVISTGWR